MAFGISGFLVQLLTAPDRHPARCVSLLVSALLLATIRREEAPPPPPRTAEPVLAEIREGLRLVRHDPDPAGVRRRPDGARRRCGASSARPSSCSSSTTSQFSPAVARPRRRRRRRRRRSSVPSSPRARRGAGASARSRSSAMLLSALGNAFIPLAPAGLPLVAIGCLVMQQLVADSAVTVYDITEVSVRQTLVHDRALGRVDVDVPRRGRDRPARSDARRPASWPRSSGCGRPRGSRRSAGCSAPRSCGSRRCGTCSSCRRRADGQPSDRSDRDRRRGRDGPAARRA